MKESVFIVAKLWIRPGTISEFETYERKAATIMKRYGGKIERAFRGTESESSLVEIHLLQFPSLESFTAYRSDDELTKLREMRESVIEKTEIFIGNEIFLL